MKPSEIHALVIGKINIAYSLTPISWPNIAFTTTDIKEYIAPTVIIGDSFVGEIGAKGVGKRVCVLMINIFTQKNKGVLRGYVIGEFFEELFGMATIMGINKSPVVFEQPSTRDKGVDSENMYQHHLFQIDFRTMIGE